MKKTYITPALTIDEQMLEQDILTQSILVSDEAVSADDAAGRDNFSIWDDDEEDYVGGCPGTFQIQTLDGSGFTVNKYYWVDNGTVTPGWYAAANGKTSIDGGASSVSIDPGKGLWVFGKGMILHMPAPTLN